MELSEVANVQFAVPVIGVVVCAVLVFAFGFKSPGQPPSFDALIDDDRKAKRNRNRRSGVAHSEKVSVTCLNFFGSLKLSNGSEVFLSEELYHQLFIC